MGRLRQGVAFLAIVLLSVAGFLEVCEMGKRAFKYAALTLLSSMFNFVLFVL
jgi:hypothetical protein